MSKLKTAFDAVNELRGVLSLSKQAEHHTHLASCRSGVGVYSVYASDVRSDLVVCTIAEFNALVALMKLGLDVNPISPEEMCHYSAADKTPLGYDKSDYAKEDKVDYTSGKFWKDAPECATHYLPLNGCFSECWVKNLNSLSYDFMPIVKGRVNEWEDSGSIIRGELDGLVKRPQSTTETPEEKEALDSIVNKPLVYTQEMADNGELPSVGMKCIAESKGALGGSCLVTVSQINKKGQFACIDHNGDYLIHYPNEDKNEAFKPIDTRTKKEKAIDEFMAKNLKGGIAFKHLISKAYDEWVGE